MRVKTVQRGFSLLEVMISIVVAGVALLGLAATQLKSLQFATNSYMYTLALVQGQNAIERMWVEQCALQHTANRYTEASFQALIKPQLSIFTHQMPPAFSTNMYVTISWQDERMTDQLLNQIRLSITYPTMPSTCV
jgi:type IV pilus assembly protein PilV